MADRSGHWRAGGRYRAGPYTGGRAKFDEEKKLNNAVEVPPGGRGVLPSGSSTSEANTPDLVVPTTIELVRAEFERRFGSVLGPTRGQTTKGSESSHTSQRLSDIV